jgi:hypothetical protein
MSAETAFVEECDAAYVHHDVVLDEIPVLDSGPYFAGEAGAREKLAGELRHAQENIGFYYIINHAAPGGAAGDRPVLNGGFLQSGRGSGRRTARHLRRPRQSAALRARMLPRLPRALLRPQFFQFKRRARSLKRCSGVTAGTALCAAVSPATASPVPPGKRRTTRSGTAGNPPPLRN